MQRVTDSEGEGKMSVIVVVIAYLVGSLPSGIIVGRIKDGVDLRQVGSGSTGATNAMRAGGKSSGILVLLLDAGKGLLAVSLAIWLGISGWQLGAVACAVVIGHCWSFWLRLATGRFSAGKGVATGIAAMVVLQPWMALMIVALAVVVIVTHYMSLASLGVWAGASFLLLGRTALTGRFDHLTVTTVVLTAIIYWRHRENIGRLLRREEKKVYLLKR
jgi:glycerol-3-phosphate acyltransferase PlsY